MGDDVTTSKGNVYRRRKWEEPSAADAGMPPGWRGPTRKVLERDGGLCVIEDCPDAGGSRYHVSVPDADDLGWTEYYPSLCDKHQDTLRDWLDITYRDAPLMAAG